jgi:hypothetical protein
MSAPARLATFAVAALLALAGGAAIGAAVGPVDDPAPAHTPTTTTTSDPGMAHTGMARAATFSSGVR